jgi:hypothetical protein
MRPPCLVGVDQLQPTVVGGGHVVAGGAVRGAVESACSQIAGKLGPYRVTNGSRSATAPKRRSGKHIADDRPVSSRQYQSLRPGDRTVRDGVAELVIDRHRRRLQGEGG